MCMLSRFSQVQLFVILWTIDLQAQNSVQGILQATISSGWPGPPPENLPNSETEPKSPALQVNSLLSEPPGKPSGNKVIVRKTVASLCTYSALWDWKGHHGGPVLCLKPVIPPEMYEVLQSSILGSQSLPWISEAVSLLSHGRREKLLSCVRLFATPWTVAHQAPPSMGFSRQEYWSGVPFPSPGIFLIQGSNPDLPHFRQTLYHLRHQKEGGEKRKK